MVIAPTNKSSIQPTDDYLTKLKLESNSLENVEVISKSRSGQICDVFGCVVVVDDDDC